MGTARADRIRHNAPDPDRFLLSEDGLLTKPFILLVAMVMLFTVGVRAPLWSIPFERDEGEYAYIAWRMDYHEQPYRDWVDQKPPGVFWVYRLALKLPMDPTRSVHLMAALFSAASAAALCLLARRFLSVFGAILAGALFGLLSASPAVQGNAANTEVFMLLPIIVSQIVFLQGMSSKGRARALYFILSGILTALAALFKQVAAVNWFFLVFMCPMLFNKSERMRKTLSFAAFSTVGTVLVWGGVSVYFCQVGGLEDFIHDVLTHNLEYVRGVTWSDRMLNLADALRHLWEVQVIAWLLAIAGLALWWQRSRTLSVFWLLAWACTSIIGVSASGYFFAHYFQQLLPVLALAAAAGAAGLDESRLCAGIVPWARRSILGLMPAVIPLGALLPFFFSYTPDEAVAQIYPGIQVFGQMPELGRRIAEITRPEDRVYVFGSEPELLFYAQRVSATRFIFLFPLYGPYAKARERQVATAEEISRAQPAAAFYFPNRLFFIPGSEQYLTSWTRNYLRQNFEPDRLLTDRGKGHVQVISAKPGAGGGADLGEVVGVLLVRKGHALPGSP